jgi:hypothetical protein
MRGIAIAFPWGRATSSLELRPPFDVSLGRMVTMAAPTRLDGRRAEDDYGRARWSRQERAIDRLVGMLRISTPMLSD